MIAGRFGAISQARSAQVKEKPTESLDAYECVLRYRAYYRDAFSAPEHAEVRDCLERAVKSDPNYAEAWAGLAHIYLDEYRQDYNPRPGSLERAFEAARRGD
jgi:adenylate cyclase